MKKIFLHVTTTLFVSLYTAIAFTQMEQINIPQIDKMHNLPQPLQIIDYRQLAINFDNTVFDFNVKGKYWPLVWIDSSKKNFPQNVIGTYTAIGDVRQGSQHNGGMFHEALNSLGSVLGATLVGIDKSDNKGWNYVSMLKNYFNKDCGWNIMMNNTCPDVALAGGGYGRDWWYDVFPNVLFYAVYSLYPNENDFDKIARTIADKFYTADSILNGDYHWSFFDYKELKPMRNQICEQADVAAGHAYVLYAAYKKFGDKKYLQGACHALQTFQEMKDNPMYEILMPFAAYVSARINAEQQTNFDVKKIIDWTFDGTAVCRKGWGVLTGNWNGFDISGICGSTIDNGGYGFLMNTYDLAIPLIPMVRYDQRFANAIGKWMLNAANAARFFYPQYIPKEHQTLADSAFVAKGVIGYEGITFHSPYKNAQQLQAPVAQGDGPLWVENQNPQVTQFSVYGSAHVGIFGSIIRKTNVDGILQLNLNATDFFVDKSFPTFLYYNSYQADKRVILNLNKSQKFNLYNTATGKFIANDVSGSVKIKIPALSAFVIVVVPANSSIQYQDNKMLCDGIVIDFHVNKSIFDKK